MNIIKSIRNEYYNHILPNRNIEAKIFESIVFCIITVSLILTFWAFRNAPDMVPKAYDEAGNVTEYVSKWRDVRTNVLLSLVVLLFLYKSYYPKRYNLDTFAHEMRQLKLASRANRQLAFCLSMVLLTDAISRYCRLSDTFGNILGITFVGCFLGVWLYYIYKIQYT